MTQADIKAFEALEKWRAKHEGWWESESPLSKCIWIVALHCGGSTYGSGPTFAAAARAALKAAKGGGK